MSPPRALDHLDELSQVLSAEKVGLFSDFDGTLTPIFDDPRDTVLDLKIRDLLAVLAEKLDLVVVVSGRGVGFLRGVVGLGGITYVGNHGMEVWASRETGTGWRVQRWTGDSWERCRGGLRELGIRGLYMEDKGSERGCALPQRS